MVPADLAAKITSMLAIPTIGIGAGNQTDGQILVWTDFAALGTGKKRRFVREYLNMREQLLQAAKEYAADVQNSNFPNQDESFAD
jgi:3-methyl-2-oxobutanoate hydroxymethyltransferase